MPWLNKDEYGQIIRIGLFEDISLATTFQIVLKDPSGNTDTYTATLGTTSATTADGQTLDANEYITYTTTDGIIDEAGYWYARAKITWASKVSYSDWKKFLVKE